MSDSIKKYWEGQQYLCEQAFNFNDAKMMAGSYDYDCVLLDLMLPEGDGLGLAIVKSICDYHNWTIHYMHNEGMHKFEISFHKFVNKH